MAFELPPVVKTAERLMKEVHSSVRRWPKFHKYSIGEDLRRQSLKVAMLAHRTFRDRAQRLHWMGRLNFAIDDLKLELQLGMQLECFRSFAEFEAIAEIARDLGRQCGGWQRKLTSNGQNASAPSARAQRPETLSTRAASPEAST